MLAGKATTLAGAVARGRTLTLRLTKPVPLLLDFLSTDPGLCAVPPTLPVDPEGAKAPLPSAAPYYVAEYVPGERLVLARNRFYTGGRTHHVARFVANLAADFGARDRSGGARHRRYGSCPGLCPSSKPSWQRATASTNLGISSRPGLPCASSSSTASRPLFRNNVKLRQAVNFAVDRTALVREAGPLQETPTDQYLLPGVAGYKNERIYPLKGPDLGRAKALAKGHTRGGKAVLYTIDVPNELARAQILKQNLRAIGLELEVKAIPFSAYFDQLFAPGAPWDFAPPATHGFRRDPAYRQRLVLGLAQVRPAARPRRTAQGRGAVPGVRRARRTDLERCRARSSGLGRQRGRIRLGSRRLRGHEPRIST